MISIRKAVVSDVRDIADAEKSYIDCPWTEQQIRDEINNKSAIFLVAEYDGEFAGYISGEISIGECEMSNIAVSARYRRRGIGKTLMSEFLCELRRQDINTVFLLVRAGNDAAIRLYEKTGFTVVGKRSRYYKGEVDALIMRLCR